MKSLIFLGPDRVGKTTLLKNTEKYLESKHKVFTSFHFKEIKPEHHSPMDQFRDALNSVYETNEYLLIDRFVSDTLFYETRRGQMPPIDPSCTLEIESLLFNKSPNSNFILIDLCWEDVYDRHVKELVKKYPESSHYWRESQLLIRKKEHQEYYYHTHKHFEERGISSILRVLSPHGASEEGVFSYCPWLK